MEKRQPLQQKLLGKLVSSLQKTETRSMFITLFQDYFISFSIPPIHILPFVYDPCHNITAIVLGL
jgi:hypothetical protein